MDIVCFDMEGTLTPEIWEQVALDSSISELSKTTREIPSYSDLMDYRIEIMKKHNNKSIIINFSATSIIEVEPKIFAQNSKFSKTVNVGFTPSA